MSSLESSALGIHTQTLLCPEWGTTRPLTEPFRGFSRQVCPESASHSMRDSFSSRVAWSFGAVRGPRFSHAISSIWSNSCSPTGRSFRRPGRLLLRAPHPGGPAHGPRSRGHVHAPERGACGAARNSCAVGPAAPGRQPSPFARRLGAGAARGWTRDIPGGRPLRQRPRASLLVPHEGRPRVAAYTPGPARGAPATGGMPDPPDGPHAQRSSSRPGPPPRRPGSVIILHRSIGSTGAEFRPGRNREQFASAIGREDEPSARGRKQSATEIAGPSFGAFSSALAADCRRLSAYSFWGSAQKSATARGMGKTDWSGRAGRAAAAGGAARLGRVTSSSGRRARREGNRSPRVFRLTRDAAAGIT
jgi:hypothetical protein